MNTDNLRRVAEDITRLVGASVSEFVPRDAQSHLLNAQRELLVALAVIVEHNQGRTPRSPSAKRTRKRAPKRPAKVTVD